MNESFEIKVEPEDSTEPDENGNTEFNYELHTDVKLEFFSDVERSPVCDITPPWFDFPSVKEEPTEVSGVDDVAAVEQREETEALSGGEVSNQSSEPFVLLTRLTTNEINMSVNRESSNGRSDRSVTVTTNKKGPPPSAHRFKCPAPDCPKSYKSKLQLTLHEHDHTGYRPYQCACCHARFKVIDHLTTHIRTHTGHRPYGCPLCSARFTQSSALSRHSLTHTGLRPHPCDQCPRAFAARAALNAHKATHRGERNHPCPTCDKRFTEAGALKRHARTHTKVKPYACPVCRRAFAERGSLRLHARTHTGYKPYACDVCDKTFRNKGNIVSHIASVHVRARTHVCRGCGKRYATATSVKRHERKAHGLEPRKLEPRQFNLTVRKTAE